MAKMARVKVKTTHIGGGYEFTDSLMEVRGDVKKAVTKLMDDWDIPEGEAYLWIKFAAVFGFDVSKKKADQRVFWDNINMEFPDNDVNEVYTMWRETPDWGTR